MAVFETKTCGRCGGTGKHSYNQVHGDMCYGCGGSGIVLSARGKEANNYFNESIYRSVDECVIGDLVYERGISSKWLVIDGINKDVTDTYQVLDNGEKNYCYIYIAFKPNSTRGQYYIKGTSIKSVKSVDEIKQKRQEALDYQDTLTKAGKPRKRKLKKA